MTSPMPPPASVTHHFIPGLRFEDTLTYQTCTQAGQTDWEQLPLDPATPEEYAGHGIWWCARRCAAVLLRQPWQAVPLLPHLPAGLPQVPELDDVTRVLERLLPRWPVVCHAAGIVRNPVAACAPALLDGGSALLLLQSKEIDNRPPHLFWAWVVGLEMRCRRAGGSFTGAKAWASSRDVERADGPQQVQALLTVPFGWPMPWSCGYAARVQASRDGMCDVGGISGRWHMGHCLAAVALSPPATPGHTGGASWH